MSFRAAQRVLAEGDANYIVDWVDLLLREAQVAGVSDIHLQPTSTSLLVRWRIDGVLHEVGLLPAAFAPNVAARFKVLADLLTYRTDTPQEGRIRDTGDRLERRVSTFPSLFGEKVVVRLFAQQRRFHQLDDLGLPGELTPTLSRLLRQTSGAIVIVGPAGSGKTTTLYACLREISKLNAGHRSLASLEDPIESVVEEVAQSQVNPHAGFDLASGLRSLMRQDPEVVAIGEMRDRTTAEGALGAALTGHLVLTTFHAPSAAGALGRLLDMGIEPYVLRSGLLAILAQRLVRALCECSLDDADSEHWLGLHINNARRAVGCPRCAGTGYRGRLVLAELLTLDQRHAARALVSQADVGDLEHQAIQAGMRTILQNACQAIEAGRTTPIEIRRVLGFENVADR
jgi:type II secretory ATPase GspE/PulE/Tfp pilus assembly ATPase PilB-like protein